MKKTAMIVLSVLWVLAIAGLIVLYVHHRNTQGTLLSAQKEISTANEKIDRLNRENAGLRGQRSNELKKTSEQVLALEMVITRKDESLQEALGNLRLAESALKEKTNEIKALNEVEGILEEKMREIEALNGAKSTLEEKMGEIDALNRRLAENDVAVKELHNKIEIGEILIKVLRGQLENSQSGVTQLEQKIKEIQKKVEESKKRIMQSETEITALLVKLENSQTRNIQLETKMKALLAELDGSKQQIAQLESKSEALLKKLETSQSRINEAETELKTFLEKVESSQQQMMKLETANKKLTGELQTALSRIDMLVKKTEEIDTLKSRLSEKDVMIRELHKKIEIGDTLVEVLRENWVTSQSRIVQLDGDNRGLTGKIEDLQSPIAGLMEEKEHLSAERAQLADALKKTESEKAALEEILSGRRAEMDRLKRQLSGLAGDKAQLQDNIMQLQSTYDAMVSELQKQIQNKEVTIKSLEDKVTISFVDRILFDFGKANVSSEGKKILTRVGNILKTTNDKNIRVVGHTDNIPIGEGFKYRFASNWELSSARAAAVIRHFQEETGIDPQHMEAVGRSFYDPIASNETEEGRAQNRRVNIIIAPRIQ